jgi:hypothetical protein
VPVKVRFKAAADRPLGDVDDDLQLIDALQAHDRLLGLDGLEWLHRPADEEEGASAQPGARWNMGRPCELAVEVG